MSISCKCLNIVVKLVEPEAERVERFDLDSYLDSHRNRQHQESAATAAATAAAATKTTAPSDDHFLFFKEALGPVRCSNVQVRFDGLLQKDRIFDEWDLSQCRYCESFVFARHVADDGNTDVTASAMITCLINPSLMMNEEQLRARMAGANYSPALGIVLNGTSLSYSDLTEMRQLLSKAKSDNQFMQRIRDYMERETEAANERIQCFTEQEFAVLKVKRERAEQDCLLLAKLVATYNQVPDELLLVRSNGTSIGSNNNGGQQNVAMTTVGSLSNSNGTNLTDSSANSQLETPPPTPEYLPMSTGNSPPMATANGSTANNRQQPITPSSSSSMVDQSPLSSSTANARLNNGRTPNRANLSYNNANNHINNNIDSYNNSRGAINRQQPQQQQPATTLMQHSSTNSLTMQQSPHRVASYEADCMFDIDGMENDNSPLSNTLSDEEELGFDESIGNNNEDGIYIPSRQLGRQNSSIARSLPISMPQLMTQFRTNEEDFEELTEDNVDIAASIKALARSVHGDTVFGDLPRPQIQRFSTQI